MNVSRNFSLAIQWILDQLIPPIIRDSKWFMFLPMKLVLRDTQKEFMTFRDTVFEMTPQEFGDLYSRTSHIGSLQGETDLNQQCIDQILLDVKGRNVLEVGCGRGLLAGLLARENVVTASDLRVGPDVVAKNASVAFREANAEKLPFGDDEFDVVISTHTLEHVQHLSTVLLELRRVAREQLVIVVPKQRPYKYGFNLHTQFFPYAWSVLGAFGWRPGVTLIDLGDWYYREDLRESSNAQPT